MAGACGGAEDVNLSNEIPCNEDTPCPTGATCLVNKCVTDGTLLANETCSQQEQCVEGLVCRDFVCDEGCTDLYYLDDCGDQTWCKPVPDSIIVTAQGEQPVGECSPSECNPSITAFCNDGSACVAIGTDIGACLPYCEYGFNNGAYFDTCTDSLDLNLACQPLGLTQVPVCMPAGGDEAPRVGLPGCDAVRNPCGAGSVCYDVVCRELCTSGQLDPCNPGQVCAPIGQRTDLSFCRAD
jgi:hypothetical protein